MKGVVPPMITPFTRDGSLDRDGLQTLVTYLRSEVDGLFVCGSYGSGPLMNLEERKEVTELSVKYADGKIPVVPMVGTTNTRDSVELAVHAQNAGAVAVAAVGPYYFRHNMADLVSFYGALIDAVEIPVYLYNNPGFQGYEIDLGTVQALKARGLAGVKDATFNILTHASYHRILGDGDFDIVLGTESMWLSACAMGTEAFIPGLANAFPEINRKMYQEGIRLDIPACRETQFKVNEIREIMYLARSTQLAVYAMLEIRGILRAYPRAPFVAATSDEIRKVREALHEAGMV